MNDPHMPDIARNTKTGQVRPCCAVSDSNGETIFLVWEGEETQPRALDRTEWVEHVDPIWPSLLKSMATLILVVMVFVAITWAM